MTERNNRLHARLVALLADCELSQTGAARLVGVTDRTVRRWIAKKAPISQAAVMLLELALETAARTGKTPREILERLGRIEDAAE